MRAIKLPAGAIELLVPYRNAKGYYFVCPNWLRPEPISGGRIIDLLKAHGVGGEWGTREIRRAVCREIKRLGEARKPYLHGQRRLPRNFPGKAPEQSKTRFTPLHGTITFAFVAADFAVERISFLRLETFLLLTQSVGILS